MVMSLIATVLLAPMHAWAVGDDDSFVFNRNGKKFYALPANGQSSAGSAELRSDRKAMGQGFMALDRSKVAGPRRIIISGGKQTKPTASLNRPSAPQNDRDVLSLFENEIGVNRVADTGKGSVAHGWPVPAGVKQHISSGYGLRPDPFSGKQRFCGYARVGDR